VQLKPSPDNAPYNVWCINKNRKRGKEIDWMYLKSSGRAKAEKKVTMAWNRVTTPADSSFGQQIIDILMLSLSSRCKKQVFCCG
jgi:hypothetical protein